MAKYTPGPFGPLKGKMGNLVASSWRDIYYLKAKPKPSTKKVTEKKLNNQNGFGFISTWLSQIHKYLLVWFKDYNPAWDGRLAAQSFNCKHALVKTDSGFDIDYREARFSFGDLPGAEDITVGREEDHLLVNWSTEVKSGACHSDAVIIILACPELDHLLAVYIQASRRDGHTKVEMPRSFASRPVHVQVAFKSVVNERISISQYAGIINLPDPEDRQGEEKRAPGFCYASGISGSLVKRVGGG